MLITPSTLSLMFQGLKTVFNQAFDNAESHYKKVSMVVPSTTREETYAWLGEMPTLREWVGDRVIRNLSLHGYSVLNKDFESTVSVKGNDIEDDRLGTLKPILAEMARSAAQHPDELVFGLLKDGFHTPCYDGQYFFDTDHPAHAEDGSVISISNMEGGDGPPWFLLDTSKVVKPMVWQERKKYQFTALDRSTDPNEYLYGVTGRGNAGYGLWQLAYASKAPLTAESYEAARQSMFQLRGERGRKLSITPTLLIVPPVLEGAAKRLLNSGSRIIQVPVSEDAVQAVAVTNEWAGTADLIVTDFIS